MSEPHRASPLANLTLTAVTSWPVVAGGVMLYPLFRFIGDPPYADTPLPPYLVGIFGPPIVLAGLLLVMSLVTRAVGKHLAGISVAALVAVAAVVAQTVVPAAGSVVAEVRQTDPLTAILPEAALLTLLWILTALSHVSISTYIRQSSALRGRERTLEHELDVLDERASDEQSRIARNIGEIAEGTLAELNSRSLDEVSAVLRAWAEEVVRPLSQSLAAGVDHQSADHEREVTSPWVTAARAVTRRDPVPVALITAVAFAASPGLLFRSYPPLPAALALIGVTVLTALGAMLVNFVTQPILPRISVPWRMLVIYVACLPLAFAELLPFMLPAALDQGQDQTEQSLSALWLGPVVSPIFVVLIVWLRIALAAGDESLALAQSRTRDLAIQVATRNLYLRQRRRAWAHALHGQVQSAMLAASIRLDREQRGGSLDQAAVSRACEPVWQALEAAQTASIDPPAWTDGIGRLHTLWDGVIDLRINVEPSAQEIIEVSGLCRSGVLDVLTESISNAVRHGHASRVEISISHGDGATVVVHALDNGDALMEGRSEGLGTALLNEVSVDWSLTRADEWNRLAVEVPALTPTDTHSAVR